MNADAVVYRAGKGVGASVVDADPITTEVIRNALNFPHQNLQCVSVKVPVSGDYFNALHCFAQTSSCVVEQADL